MAIPTMINDMSKFRTWLTFDRIQEFADDHFEGTCEMSCNGFALPEFLEYGLKDLVKYAAPSIVLLRFKSKGYGREFDVYFEDKAILQQLPEYYYGKPNNPDNETHAIPSDLYAKIHGLTAAEKLEEYVSGNGPEDYNIRGNVIWMWWD